MPEVSDFEILLGKYFPDSLSDLQVEQFKLVFNSFIEWNEKINLISRKDIENLAERHFLHSLSIAKVIQFEPGTTVLDVGTGGGFPGIPLAIFYPETRFHLVDSIAKKIKVVDAIVQHCGLKNVQFSIQRAEEVKTQFDFVVSRAVSRLGEFSGWVKPRIHCRCKNQLPNGILYLKGGDIADELKEIKGLNGKPKLFPISDYFSEEFFSSKYVVHLPFCQ